MAHSAPHIWNNARSQWGRSGNHQGLDASCERQRHDGPLRPGHHASQKAGPTRDCGAVGPKWTHAVDGWVCNCLNVKGWALNSAVECHLHTVEVRGSNPLAPTMPSTSTVKHCNCRFENPRKTAVLNRGFRALIMSTDFRFARYSRIVRPFRLRGFLKKSRALSIGHTSRCLGQSSAFAAEM